MTWGPVVSPTVEMTGSQFPIFLYRWYDLTGDTSL